MNRALQWKLIAGFLLVFIAGGTTGAFLGASHVRKIFFESPRRGMMGERMRERLRTELNLTSEQLAKISPIIDKAAGQLQEVRRDTGERVRELIKQTHREIGVHLTEEQRARLEKIEARHSKWMKHGRGFRRWHSPSPPAASAETPDS